MPPPVNWCGLKCQAIQNRFGSKVEQIQITAALEHEGYRIITAEDGIQAVAMAEQARPDLILMDMQLPKMSGREATRQIKANSALASIPIIALTANAMKGDREETLTSGCDDYLTKPFDPIELQEMVRKWIKA